MCECRRTRGRYDEPNPIALVMLHKRISLALKIKSKISKDTLDRLRSGLRSGFGYDLYPSVATEARLIKAAKISLTLALTGSMAILVINNLFGKLVRRRAGRAGHPGQRHGVVLRFGQCDERRHPAHRLHGHLGDGAVAALRTRLDATRCQPVGARVT